jgi:hypothetical protein
VVTPLLVWSLGKTNNKLTVRHIVIGMAAASLYAVVRFSLPHYGTVSDVYTTSTPIDFVKSLYRMFSTLLFPVDNVYLMYNHNYLATALSLILASPLSVLLLAHARQKEIKLLTGICLCVFIAMSPHLITRFSNMHVYGATVQMAILWAYLIDRLPRRRSIQRQYYACLLCSVMAIIAIDAHHIEAKYQSGQKKLTLGHEALALLSNNFHIKSGSNDRIYSITLTDNSYKYSTFCANAEDAFCWGNSVEMLTHYTWPKQWTDTAVDYTPEMIRPLQCKSLRRIADKAFDEDYDAVLTVSDHGVCMFPRKNKNILDNTTL